MKLLPVIRRFALYLPGTEEGTLYGTPAFRVGGRHFLRLHGAEEALVVRLESVREQKRLLAEDPENTFVPEAYEGQAAILVRPEIGMDALWDLTVQAWRRVATPEDLQRFENRNPLVAGLV